MSVTRSKPAIAGVISLPARLIRWFTVASLALWFGGLAHADPVADQREISAVIQDYLRGSSYNQRDRLSRAFHPDARLYLSQGTDVMTQRFLHRSGC